MSPVPVPGGPFFGPPFPPAPFRPGVRVSPRSPGFPQGPGASRCPNSPPCAFRPASGTGGQVPGLHALLPGCQASRLSGPRCPGIRSTSRTAFMGPVARARLSGAQASRPAFMLSGPGLPLYFQGGHAFRRFSGGHASPGLPGDRVSLNFFSSQHLRLLFLLRSLQAFSLQEARGQTSPQASGVQAFR